MPKKRKTRKATARRAAPKVVLSKSNPQQDYYDVQTDNQGQNQIGVVAGFRPKSRVFVLENPANGNSSGLKRKFIHTDPQLAVVGDVYENSRCPKCDIVFLKAASLKNHIQVNILFHTTAWFHPITVAQILPFLTAG